MPLNQREAIAEAINKISGKTVFEFGCGGTTKWLLENTTLGRLVTVDNSRKWLQECIENIDPFWMQTGRWVPRYVPVKIGANATIGEEQHLDDEPHWHAAEQYADACLDEDGASVFLVDGVLRAKCLRHIYRFHRNRESCAIFLHDTHRDWYDDAITKAIEAGFKRTDYPEGEDYPGCLLTKLEKSR